MQRHIRHIKFSAAKGTRSSWEQEYPCHTADKRLWFSCQMTLGFIDEKPHVVIAHENITKIKLTQEDLQEAKENAVQASLAKCEFLAAMSNELRTPLNGILGMNALLLRTDLNERQRRFVEACLSSGKLLTELIDNVLDLSKIEAGKLELGPRECELEAMVYDVIELFSNVEQGSQLRLSCRLSPETCVTAHLDDNRLRQILANLVGNAIKFTSTGSVTVTGERRELPSGQSRLRMEFTDTGIGIPPERKNRLSKPFSQVDSSTTRNFGGTGLGLSICKQLVSLMSGQIGVERQVGLGSTFWFEIPLEVISETQPPINRQQSLSGVPIIVVDGIGSLSQASQCVTNWRCSYTHAETFQQALNLFDRSKSKNNDSPIVFSSLPAMKGEQDMSKKVIERCSGRMITILTTEEEVPAEMIESIEAGKTLREPVRPSNLFEAITSLLSPNKDARASQSEGSSSGPPARLTGHLLVAEDNKINQLYVSELLKILGCTCDIVVNGEEVLSLLEQIDYDLVLMDCQMPEMDGFTATQEIRSREKKAISKEHIPIVAVTANALEGDRERCLAAGMDDYVSKPIDGDESRMILSRSLSPALPFSPTESQQK